MPLPTTKDSECIKTMLVIDRPYLRQLKRRFQDSEISSEYQVLFWDVGLHWNTIPNTNSLLLVLYVFMKGCSWYLVPWYSRMVPSYPTVRLPVVFLTGQVWPMTSILTPISHVNGNFFQRRPARDTSTHYEQTHKDCRFLFRVTCCA